MEQEVSREEGINWLNESNWLDNEQIGGMCFASEHINLFFPWTESTASPPTVNTMSDSEKGPQLTWPFLNSPPVSLFFVFTCPLSLSRSCGKAQSSQAAGHLWKRSDLTPWSLTHAVFLPCGRWLSCPLFLFSYLSTGLGYCLTFLPTVTILAQYFSRRRALVTSVASSGESLAIFAFAPGECTFKQGLLSWLIKLSIMNRIMC